MCLFIIYKLNNFLIFMKQLLSFLFISLLLYSCSPDPGTFNMKAYKRGLTQLKGGNTAEAERFFEQAAFNPKFSMMAHYQLALLNEKQDETLGKAIWHYQQFCALSKEKTPFVLTAEIRQDIAEKKYLKILNEKWNGDIDTNKNFKIKLLEERQEVLKQNLQQINEENYILRQLLLEEKEHHSLRKNITLTKKDATAPPQKKEALSSIVKNNHSMRMYKVLAGDTLGNIAKEYYGSSSPANIRKILTANSDKLSTPDKLRIGQLLIIP